MSEQQLSLGIDRQPGRTYVAQISRLAGRPIVEYLGTDEPPNMEANVHRVFAVPQEMTSIKHIRITPDETYASGERARFEFTQSLLEPEQSFAIELQPAQSSDRYIGVAVRKSELARIAEKQEDSVDRYQSRSLALLRAFNTFCDHGAGEYHAVLELTPGGLILALLYQGKAARIIHVRTERSLTSEKQFRSLAGEIKTALSFHQSSLFHEGVTVPLSRIHLSVENADLPLLTALRQLTGTEIRTPLLNRFSFAPSVTIPVEEQHRYLVALGLALE